MEITGGCVCGGTRYVLKNPPFSLGDCHCIDCRRSAGAPHVNWGSVPREDLVVTKGERSGTICAAENDLARR
ncbi:MAG: hypothetical protein DME62_14110 [Verrucomicrobia bacterium]|nr:MAG: hypothetical protein DME62_14110 [Verrucomicrobiota bacterium]